MKYNVYNIICNILFIIFLIYFTEQKKKKKNDNYILMYEYNE